MSALEDISALMGPSAFSSNRRLASVVAIMVALQSPTLASTYQRRNSFRPDLIWRGDYSSDNYQHHNLYPFPSPAYCSEDEYEEQILSALAKADASNDDSYASSDSSIQRRKTMRRKRKRKRRRRHKKKQPGFVSIETDEDVAKTLQPRTKVDGTVETSDEAISSNSMKGGSLSSKEAAQSENIMLKGAGFNASVESQQTSVDAKEHKLNSRSEALGTRIGTRGDRNPAGRQPEPRPWGTRQAYHKGGNAFVKPNQSNNSLTANSGPNPAVDSRNTPPSTPPIPQPSVSKASSPPPPPASQMRPNSNPPASTSRHTIPKPKRQSASVRPPTLTAAKDSNVSPWVRKFHSTRPKDCLVLVPRDYLLDNFNLARLAPVVEHLANVKQKELEATSPNVEERNKSPPINVQQQSNNQLHSTPRYTYPIYRQALELILRQQDDTKEEPSQVVQYAAEVLYTLVHSRYVVSPRGLETIRSRLIVHGSKSINKPLFGRCPRLDCGGMPLLPCGLSDDFDSDHVGHDIGNSKAKRYCCNCRETFHCWESKVDGSAWGTSVCHLLLMVFGKHDLFPSHFATPCKNISSSESAVDTRQTTAKDGFYGRIFGFPIHPSAAIS